MMAGRLSALALALALALVAGCDSSKPENLTRAASDESPDAAPTPHPDLPNLPELDSGARSVEPEPGSPVAPTDPEPETPAPDAPDAAPPAEPEPIPAPPGSETPDAGDVSGCAGADCAPSVDPCAEQGNCPEPEPEPEPPMPQTCVAGSASCPAPKHICSATAFESTQDDCAETSFIWNGTECASTTHCGCDAGDCDRVHPDAPSCESAHTLCIPDGCEAQDARSSGAMCGTLEGYAFDGAQCRQVICGCRGDECDQLEETLDGCQQRFVECIERVPLCTDDSFPLVASGNDVTPWEPTYPEYTFTVEGLDELAAARDASSGWTPAEWLGWEDIAEPDATCMPLPNVIGSNCPYPRRLLLQVGTSLVTIDVSLHWHVVGEVPIPSSVEVRIDNLPNATTMLKIRDPETERGVLLVTTSEADVGLGSPSWGLAPFVFGAAEALCRTEANECNWSFGATGLAVSSGGQLWEIPPLTPVVIDRDGVSYTVLHGYLLLQSVALGEASCSRLYSPRQTFAFVRNAAL